MKKIVLLASLIIVSKFSMGQNDPLITNYMFTPISINPAFAGQSNAMNGTLLARQQWIGFKEAPSTQILNFDTKVDKLGGVGLSVMNDMLGFEQSIKVKALYSRVFTIDTVSTITFGGGFGLINKSIDGTKLTYENLNDTKGIYSNQSVFTADLDLGALYRWRDLRVGLSATHIFTSKQNATFFNVPRNLYLFSDYIQPINGRMDLIPSVLLKVSAVTTQFEAGALVMLDKKYWGGLTYRTGATASLLLGMNFMQNYSFGYSYDMCFGPVNGYTSGTHEIFIRMNILKQEKPYQFYKSPRYFN